MESFFVTGIQILKYEMLYENITNPSRHTSKTLLKFNNNLNNSYFISLSVIHSILIIYNIAS